MGTTVVNTKSAWKSKINWAQAIGFGAMLGSIFGLDITPEQQVAVITTIGLVQSGATIVMKTFFSNTITPSSAK